ncbi:hypothetical protein [Streptomyces sp. NPDC054874]
MQTAAAPGPGMRGWSTPANAAVGTRAFGPISDYGIAMAKGHREDCKKLKQALVDYAQSNDWNRGADALRDGQALTTDA